MMSFTQLKWRSLLFLSLILFLGLPSIVLSDNNKLCEEHCKKHRTPNTTEAFSFDCRSKYDNEQDMKTCSQSCLPCRETKVCEENENRFNCPDIGIPTTTTTEKPERKSPIIGIVIIDIILVLVVGGCIFAVIYMGQRQPKAWTPAGQAPGGVGNAPGSQVAASGPTKAPV